MSDERDPIDVSLQRLFAVPELGRVHAQVEAAAARATRPGGGARVRWMVALASAAAAAIVVVFVATRDDAVVRDDAPSVTSVADARRHVGARLAELYARGPTLPRVDDGGCMEEPPPPDDACTSEGGAPRLVAAAGLEVIGACGGPGAAGCVDVPVTRMVHVRWEGTDVLVCVEARDRDPQPVLPEGAGLSVFRRELGAHVLYEITPLAEPHALAHFER